MPEVKKGQYEKKCFKLKQNEFFTRDLGAIQIIRDSVTK